MRTLAARPVRTPEAVLRALADPTRRTIFERLIQGEVAVKDLTARARVSQPAVSQHLAVLRAASLVTVRREGRIVYYRAKPQGLKPLVNWLVHYQEFWPRKISRLRTLLEEMEP
jgi:DNA-binding transcriptional ArsR family regulator